MKKFMFSVALSGALGVSTLGGSGAQQQGTSTFQIAFCNMSDYANILVAVVHRKDAQNWAVDGWYPVPDYGCAPVGNFLRDTVYYYAFSSEGVDWQAAEDDQTATIQCVDYDKWFEAIASGISRCPTGRGNAVRFKMITVPAQLARITWTLTGSK
jgi:hypothetical protein